MARGRSNRRRRRGKFSALLKVLSFFVVLGALIAALTLFFKMDHILVTGNARYSEQEVLDASGLSIGDNLYMMNKYTVKERLFSRLPYLEEVAINRKLPDTLLIEVRESVPVAAVESGTETWLIALVNGKGKLLERTADVPQGCPLVTGETLLSPEAGGAMTFSEEAAYRADVIVTLLTEARERGMLAEIGTVEMGDETALQFRYLDRFTVKLPWTSDIGYKLSSVVYVVGALESNQTGTINLMKDGKVSFIP